MTKRLNAERYGESINARVEQTTKDKIIKIALNTNRSKGEVIRSLLDVGLTMAAIKKQRADQE